MNYTDIIKEYNYILSGCKTILDAIYFTELYSKDKSNEIKNLLMSLIYSHTYYNIIDLCNLKEILNNINNISIDNNDNINTYINDPFQTKIFIRIANIINVKSNKTYKKNKLIKKYCPHCNRKFFGNHNNNYIICGLDDDKNGFNWDGCGHDWCFTCGKKLCKNWVVNKLFLDINRTHDGKCCCSYAKENNDDYNNYCQCNNKYINRIKYS